MSYASQHARTALRTLPWYVLPPALLTAMLFGLFGLIERLRGLSGSWDAVLVLTLGGGVCGLIVWLLRQFMRILQIARHYSRIN